MARYASESTQLTADIGAAASMSEGTLIQSRPWGLRVQQHDRRSVAMLQHCIYGCRKARHLPDGAIGMQAILADAYCEVHTYSYFIKVLHKVTQLLLAHSQP